MASLEDNLNQLLSDPNAMEQIFSLAGKLGMSSEPSDEPEAEEQPLSEREPEAAELSQPLFGAEGLGGLGKLSARSEGRARLTLCGSHHSSNPSQRESRSG